MVFLADDHQHGWLLRCSHRAASEESPTSSRCFCASRSQDLKDAGVDEFRWGHRRRRLTGISKHAATGSQKLEIGAGTEARRSKGPRTVSSSSMR